MLPIGFLSAAAIWLVLAIGGLFGGGSDPVHVTDLHEDKSRAVGGIGCGTHSGVGTGRDLRLSWLP